MRVLILFSSSELGGAERSLSRMALASSSIEYVLATVKSNGPWCEWVRSQGKDPLVFGRGGSHGSGSMFGAMLRLFRYLRSCPVDVIYVCGLRVSSWMRLLRFFIPSMKLVHGVRWNPDGKSRLDRSFRLVERNTSFLVDGWITNSLTAQTTLVQRCGIAKERVSVIYNGVDPLPKQLPHFDTRPMDVLTVANLNPRKGHREYLGVIQMVIRRVPNARFVLVGRDDMDGAVQRAITQLGLQNHITYEGFQSDVTPWLRRARIFVLPSLWGEGCPTSILEAFSFAIPVIAHAIDGVPELVEEGKDGYLLPVGDMAMADRIVELLLNPSLAESMGRNGRAKVEERFVIAACVDRHETAFKKWVNR